MFAAALALLAAGEPVAWESITARINAQGAFDRCVQDWTLHFVHQTEPAETIADTAIRLCQREQALFIKASVESIPNPADASEWISARTHDIRNRAIDFVLIYRSDIPTKELNDKH